MKKIEIQANKLSSKRTKNRIKENGPRFEFVERNQSVIAFGNEPGILVKSLDTKWLGWLPEIEIIVTNL